MFTPAIAVVSCPHGHLHLIGFALDADSQELMALLALNAAMNSLNLTPEDVATQTTNHHAQPHDEEKVADSEEEVEEEQFELKQEEDEHEHGHSLTF